LQFFALFNNPVLANNQRKAQSSQLNLTFQAVDIGPGWYYTDGDQHQQQQQWQAYAAITTNVVTPHHSAGQRRDSDKSGCAQGQHCQRGPGGGGRRWWRHGKHGGRFWN
jgi:hypothetical protein